MAVLLRVDGTYQRISPADKATGFTCKELYPLIDTNVVETAKARDGRIMIIDEEGKLKGKSVNQVATRLYIHGDIDPIVGDVVLCNDTEFQ